MSMDFSGTSGVMTIKNYKKSITKEQINVLPLVKFDGTIKIITNDEELGDVLKQLENEKILGFDTETRPCFKKGEGHSVSLLQLASSEKVYLFRLNFLKFPEELKRILSSAKIKKIGLAVHDDIKALQRLSSFKSGGFIDLADVSFNLKIKNRGLKSLVGIFLGRRISKAAKLTNWENKKLTRSQIEYAATDAWVPKEVYLHMVDNGIIDKNGEKI